MPRRAPLALAALLLLLPLAACDRGTPVPEQTVTVACGRCIFGMEQTQGCEWAAEVGGAHYLVRGPVPHDHVSHAPDGMCNVRRRALVEGRIRGDLLVASRFELLPAEEVPATPRFTPDDLH